MHLLVSSPSRCLHKELCFSQEPSLSSLRAAAPPLLSKQNPFEQDTAWSPSCVKPSQSEQSAVHTDPSAPASLEASQPKGLPAGAVVLDFEIPENHPV